MEKETQVTVFILLVAVSSTSTIQVSTAELSTEMPLVYVEPQSAFAAVGTIFNVSVKIFNLTNTFYGTNEEWQPGEPLPPLGIQYNYTLGNMYGFNVNFSWNPEVLEYVDHTVHTPVQDYPDGVLNGPIWNIEEDMNSTEGTYSIAQNSAPLVEEFNCPNNSATVFTITFSVKEERPSLLNLENVKLTPNPALVVKGIRDVIPHKAINGMFTPVETTRLTGLDVGSLVGAQMYTPLIFGENATIRVHLSNDGSILNSYNLTLYRAAVSLKTWNGSLAQNEKNIYNYTLKTEELGTGLHTLTARATILHNKTTIIDSFTKNFSIVDAPKLSITSSPNIIHENDTATLSAVVSFNRNPNNQIVNYRWLLYEPKAIIPTYEYEDVNVTHTFIEEGTWRVTLVVKDEWGITYNTRRNATFSYLEEALLDVHAGVKPPPPSNNFPYEPIVILIISLILITVIGTLVYITRKKRP